MKQLFQLLLTVHIAAGFFSLVFFWLPVLVKKGSKLHRKTGKAYVWLMWVVLITAGILSIINASQERYESAILLGFLTLLTGLPLWEGIMVLRQSKQLSLTVMYTRRMLRFFLFVFSMVCIALGIYMQLQDAYSLMMVFGILGALTGKDFLKSSAFLSDNSQPITSHLEGMIVSGIAAHTAFFAFGGSKFLSSILTDGWMIIPWILPTAIGVVCISFYKRKLIAKTQ